MLNLFLVSPTGSVLSPSRDWNADSLFDLISAHFLGSTWSPQLSTHSHVDLISFYSRPQDVRRLLNSAPTAILISLLPILVAEGASSPQLSTSSHIDLISASSHHRMCVVPSIEQPPPC